MKINSSEADFAMAAYHSIFTLLRSVLGTSSSFPDSPQVAAKHPNVSSQPPAEIPNVLLFIAGLSQKVPAESGNLF